MAELSDAEEQIIKRTEELVRRSGLPGITVVRGTPHSLHSAAPGLVERIERKVVQPSYTDSEGKTHQFSVSVNRGADFVAENPTAVVAASTLAPDDPRHVTVTDTEADVEARKQAPLVVAARVIPGAVVPAVPEDADRDWVTFGDEAEHPVSLASNAPTAAAEVAKAPTTTATKRR